VIRKGRISSLITYHSSLITFSMSESVQAVPPFVDAPAPYDAARKGVARPTAREWTRHALLFFLTVVTTTIAGIMMAVANSNQELEPGLPPPQTLPGYLIYVPEYYLKSVALIVGQAFIHPSLLAQGFIFSCALLAILTAHEFGHYIACRRYGVDVTLPFFIPAPPLFLAGTFGAFIKIKSPIPSRRALFDIGVAGPLAGFVVALPVAIIGLLAAHAQQPAPGGGEIILHDSLLMQIFARMLHVNLDAVALNPFSFAAWIGLLVTSLNLMPVGQLDGGHATYSVFGPKIHKQLGRIAFLTVSALALLGWFLHSSPSGFLYAVLLGVMLKVRHPQPANDYERLNRGRLIVAALTLLVFVLSFLPFPISIT